MGQKTFSIRETATFESLSATLVPSVPLEPVIVSSAPSPVNRASFGRRTAVARQVAWPSQPERKSSANRFTKALRRFWHAGSPRRPRRA